MYYINNVYIYIYIYIDRCIHTCIHYIMIHACAVRCTFHQQHHNDTFRPGAMSPPLSPPPPAQYVGPISQALHYRLCIESYR